MSGRRVNEAAAYNATMRFFSWKTESPLTDPPAALGWTREQWDSISPGAKREIERDLRRRGQIDDLCSPPKVEKSLRERKADVEYAGRKRF